VKAPQRGEVWLVDLGMAAKVRPAVVISVPSDGQSLCRERQGLITPMALTHRLHPSYRPGAQVHLRRSAVWAGIDHRPGKAVHDEGSSRGADRGGTDG
jgi:hypothetical protein